MVDVRRLGGAGPGARGAGRVHSRPVFLGLHRGPGGARRQEQPATLLRALQSVRPLHARCPAAGERRADVDRRGADHIAVGVPGRVRGHARSAGGRMEIRRAHDPRRGPRPARLSHSLSGIAALPATSPSPGWGWSKRRRTCRRRCCGRHSFSSWSDSERRSGSSRCIPGCRMHTARRPPRSALSFRASRRRRCSTSSFGSFR